MLYDTFAFANVHTQIMVHLYYIMQSMVSDNSRLTSTFRTMKENSDGDKVIHCLIRDIYCGPEVLFETCVAMKFVDDDDDDDAVAGPKLWNTLPA